MHRVIVFLCCLTTAAVPTSPQTQVTPNTPKSSDWLPAIVSYAFFVQHAFYWQRIDAERGRLVIDVNGKNYTVVTGQPVSVVMSPPVTRACFGERINIATEIFGLPKPEKPSWGEIILKWLVDGHLDEMPKQLPPNVGLKIFKGAWNFASVLEFYLSYREIERGEEADRIQRYLDTQVAEDDIKALLPSLEQHLRVDLDPAAQEALALVDGDDRSQRTLNFIDRLKSFTYGRAKCFPDLR